MRFNKTHLLSTLLPFYCLVSFWLSACVSPPPSVKEEVHREASSKNSWVASTLRRMTLEEKISQMMMSYAYGYYYSSTGDEYRRLEHLVKDRKVGGLIFLQGDVYETAMVIERMQQESIVPLLTASDFEWGAAMRIRRATRFPEAMALGATRDTTLAFRMGNAIAEESRAIGIWQVFAPVVDVNVNPDNPVINTRSFGENPQLVAGMAGAFVTGLQSGGVLATAKHFPGHGDTQTDSHLDVPVINASRQRLDSVELLPYRNLIQRSVASVMVAHLEVPSVEHTQQLPATLSHEVVGDLLQNQLGFKGLVVTDAMEMGAVVGRFGVDSAAVMAVEAGDDMLLMLPDEDAAVRALSNAVRSGRIPESRIDQSVTKILGLKWDLGLPTRRSGDIHEIPNVVATVEHSSLAKQIARSAITLLKNDGILPLEHSGNKKILSVIVSDNENYRTDIHRTTSPWPNEPVGDYFTALFRKRYARVETIHIDPTSNDLDFDGALKKVKTAGLILCPIFTKARSGSGKFGLPDEITGFLKSLTAVGTPTVVIAMGSPYILDSIPNANAYICSYSDCEPITEATVEALFGEIAISGKLPVTVPGMFAYGSGIELSQSALRKDVPGNVGFKRDGLEKVDSIITKAIRDTAFPGAQVLVVKDGAVVYNKSFGRFEYSDTSRQVRNSTMYDLASLTKVVATTTAVMKLYDEGELQLDDPVVKYIPEFGNHGKERITLRNLLVHNGGLPPFKRLYLTCTSPQEVLDSVYQTETIYRAGDSTLYSDFDFILLGKVIERVTGKPLDEYVNETFFRPLGMSRTMYRPPEALREDIAPTEYDSLYRKTLVRGVVHDENAYALGGVSGHAGLFSNTSDLAVFMQMLMNGGNYGGRQYLKPETVKLFTTKQSSISTRALGWDTKPTSGYSSAGSLFGEKSFGHTGFTGTSIWADPDKNVVVIFLTNRVYPTRNNMKIAQVRPAVGDAVVHALK